MPTKRSWRGRLAPRVDTLTRARLVEIHRWAIGQHTDARRSHHSYVLTGSMQQSREANVVSVRPASEFTDTVGSIPATDIVHLKGFASGIDYKNHEVGMQRTISFILQTKPRIIVWDGDDFSQDSFTYLIPQLFKVSNNLRFVAFRAKQEASRFQENWTQALVDINFPNIDLFVVESLGPHQYVQLAQFAWETTGSSHFVCFGGAQGILDEYTTYTRTTKTSRSIQWSVCPATRIRQGREDRASLESRRIEEDVLVI